VNNSTRPTRNDRPLRWRVLASAVVSVLILFLLWWIVSSGEQLKDARTITVVLQNTSWWLASFYILTTILQTLLRALRYRSLLKAEENSPVPGVTFMFFVTLARNMFVDMVPARIGEASYILMLNRAVHVPVSACLSTLFISIVLDVMALAVLLITLVLASIISASQSGITLGHALLGTSVLVFVAVLLIYMAVPLSQWFSRMIEFTRIKILQRFARFLIEVGMSIRRVQRREILSLTMAQSIGIRVLKYSGLYILFIAVTTASFPEFSLLPWWQVLPAFISAEAAASLPLPTFMSFGTYEGGGLLAFSIQGFAAADIFIVMFVIHLISQVVDYTLGGLGLLGFFLQKGEKKVKVKGLLETGHE